MEPSFWWSSRMSNARPSPSRWVMCLLLFCYCKKGQGRSSRIRALRNHRGEFNVPDATSTRHGLAAAEPSELRRRQTVRLNPHPFV